MAIHNHYLTYPRYALQPKFTIHEVTTQLDTKVTLTRDIYGARYLPVIM
jgi:hypothetical protein